MKRLSHRIPTTTQMAIFFLCLFVPALTAQSVIQGLVVYPDGQPAAGALVVLDGTDIYATTDSTGAYQISTDFAGPYKVQVFQMCYKTATGEFPARTSSTWDVVLEESFRLLDNLNETSITVGLTGRTPVVTATSRVVQ